MTMLKYQYDTVQANNAGRDNMRNSMYKQCIKHNKIIINPM